MSKWMWNLCFLWWIVNFVGCDTNHNSVHSEIKVFHSKLIHRKNLATKPIRPKLNRIHSFEEIEVNGTFEVECVGNRPIDWSIMHNFENLSGDINIVENFDPDNRDFPFTSKLTLTGAQYTDTTLYTCKYNETNDDDNVASIYLYVNDETHLLVPVFQLLTSSPKRNLEIPCRPTFSKANVTLWKKEGSEKTMVNLEENYVHYDPTRGFLIYRPHVYYSGLFYCKTTLGDLETKTYIILEFISSIDDMPTPTIEEEGTDHVKISSNFSLNCLVDIALNGMAALVWDYPGKLNTKTKGRYLVKNATSSNYKPPHSDTTYQRVQSRLSIFNAQKSDDGFYTCTFTQNDQETKHTTAIKVIGEDMELYINVTMQGTKSWIAAKESTNAILVFNVESSFSKQDLDVSFYKDGHKLENKKKYNITSASRRYNGTTIHDEIIVIRSITRRDSGNYSIEVRNEDYVGRDMVRLFVIVPPIARVEGELGMYDAGKKYTLHCEVDGFPWVDILWKWRRCNDFDDCPSPWSDMDNVTTWDNEPVIQNSTNRTLPYKPRRSLEVKAIQSGEYLCFGSNKLNVSEYAAKFIVTDVPDGFAITDAPNRIIEGDNVQLTCKAHLFMYANISWDIVDSNGQKVPLNKSVNKWEITEGKSGYSLSSRIYATNITTVNETVICVGQSLDNQLATELTNYTLRVQPGIMPKFLSNETNKLELKMGGRSTLNCSSIGVPKPVVSWFKNDLPFENNNFVTLAGNGQALLITAALRASVEGTYKCQVRNRKGYRERTFNVLVEDDESLSTETIALAVVLPIIIILFFIVGFCWIRRVHRERAEKAELKLLSQELFNKGEIELLNPDMPLDDQVELLPYDHRWEFPKERLKMGRILGQGAFGRVVRAEAIGLEDEGSTTVAVKMLKERADKTQRKALVAELKILIHLKKHLNIVNLLGAVTKNMMKGELLVMVEFCRFGNLRNYLLKRKNRFVNQLDPETGQVDPDFAVLPGSPVRSQLAANQGLSNPIYGQKVNYADLMHESNTGNSYNVSMGPSSPDTTGGRSGPFRWLSMNEEDDACQPVTTCDLLSYAFQVARGMQYLSSRKLLHRDLAARNVLLADDNVVKICDFGLAKDCYNYDTYRIQGNGPLPIKWMALESLSDKVYTIKSDVWSFGILLWEFFTLGGDPYPGVDLDEEFFKRLKGGYRMEKPDYAPNNVYRIMLHCWNSEPEQRPDFETLGDIFGDFLQAGVKDFYLQLDNQYADMNAMHKQPDYLAMSETNYLTMNHDDDKGPTVNYDNVNSVRPIDNGPVLSDPMLAVPMIQLEPLNLHKNLKNKGRPAPNTPDVEDDTSKRETDYLMMDNTAGENKSFSRQRKGNESLRSDASSGFHSDLDTSGENSVPPSYNLVMGEDRMGIEV